MRQYDANRRGFNVAFLENIIFWTFSINNFPERLAAVMLLYFYKK